MADDLQFYVDDTSPSIAYIPFADTLSTPNLQAGWNPYFSSSGFAKAPGESGNGTSFHITSLSGALLTLRFNGTGIQLIGNATNATYSLTLDGIPTQPNSSSKADNILASFYGLPNSPHSVSLTTIISSVSSFVAFDKALITAPPPNHNSSGTFTFPTQALPDKEITFLGSWSLENNTIGGNTSFHQSTTAGDHAHASFIGTSLLLKGLISPESGQYSVTVDNDTTTTTTFSARSSFIQPDTLLFFASGLDPQTSHDIEVRNVDGSLLALKLGGFEAIVQTPSVPSSSTSACPSPTHPPPSAPSDHYPRGTIAALVLGGVLFIILFASILFFFNQRPRLRRRRRECTELKARLPREGMVLDIRGGGQQWRAGYDDGVADALDIVESSRGLDLDLVDLKSDPDDVNKVSSLLAVTDSLKSEPKSRSPRSWLGQKITRSRSGSKSKTSSPSISYTIDLQLTPPKHSSQTLPLSASGSQPVDPISPPSLSALPNLQHTLHIVPPTTEMTAISTTENSTGTVDSPTSPAASQGSSMPRHHKHLKLQDHDRKERSSLLTYGLPNTPGSGDSSIEYLDVVASPVELGGGEYDDDGAEGLGPRATDQKNIGPSTGALLDGAKQKEMQRGEEPSEKPQDQERTAEAAIETIPKGRESTAQDQFLGAINTSPFRLEFVEGFHRASGKSGSSHVRFQEDPKRFSQKPEETVPQITIESKPAHPHSSQKFSFLDFSASSNSSGSLLTHSSSSSSRRNLNVSRWSSTTVPSTRASLPSIGSQDPSGGSTHSFPFPVSMSPLSGQPHSAFNTLMQNQPQYTSPPPEHTLHLPQVGRHPELDAAPSPTDSIPMTVSDIFFRQSVSDDGGSRPVSTGSQLLPPHPPLSGLPTVDESEYSHSQNGSPSPDLLNPQQTSRALANTPFIVQRVLGVNNPVLSSPISHDHTRSGSASNPVSMSGYATPLVRDDDVSPNPGYAPRLGRPR